MLLPKSSICCPPRKFITWIVRKLSDDLAQSQWRWVLSDNGVFVFQPWVLAVAAVGTGAILWWLHRLPYQRTQEEQLQEAREQQFVGT